MFITSIEKVHNKYAVYIDEEYYFSLYYKELKHYNLKTSTEINPNTIELIGNDVIVRRGIQYVYHLIATRDYTTYKLKQKLRGANYRDEYINQIIHYVENKGIVNDQRFAKEYYRQMKEKKSLMAIKYDLIKKGINKLIVEKAIEDQEHDEYPAIRRLALKKTKGKSNLTYEEKNKLLRYLYNKGFAIDRINKVIHEIQNDWENVIS